MQTRSDRPSRAAPMAPDDRRTAILDAAVPLLRERGLGATTRELAQAAGVAEGTLFRVFPDKEALLGAAIHRAMDPDPVVRELEAIDPLLDLAPAVSRAVEILTARSVDVANLMAMAHELACRSAERGPATAGAHPAGEQATGEQRTDAHGAGPQRTDARGVDAHEVDAHSLDGHSAEAHRAEAHGTDGYRADAPGPGARGAGLHAPAGGRFGGLRGGPHLRPGGRHPMEPVVDAVADVLTRHGGTARLRREPAVCAQLLVAVVLTTARSLVHGKAPALTPDDLVELFLDGALLEEPDHLTSSPSSTPEQPC